MEGNVVREEAYATMVGDTRSWFRGNFIGTNPVDIMKVVSLILDGHVFYRKWDILVEVEAMWYGRVLRGVIIRRA
jgi:hypothetical protein